MRKKFKRSHPRIIEIQNYINEHITVQDVADTEKEFGEMVSTSWELIAHYPTLHKKVVLTAHKLRELKAVLQQNGQLNKTVH